MSSNRPAAFFDLDRTLIPFNTARIWFARERAAGRLSLAHTMEAAIWFGLYGLGLMDAERAFGRAAAAMAGQSEEEMAQRTRCYFDEELAGRFAPGGLAALDRHRQQGEALVLLTSSSPYLSRCVADQLGLDSWLCTSFKVEEGIFTGELDLPLCYGDGKVVLAERWAAEAGVDLDASWFYTDSITDLPMLDRVGHPVVIQPDGRLLRMARKRGWPVEDWH